MDLGLAVRAQRDQLGPVPDQLAELPSRRRRDPGLREPTHPEQVGQVGRVPKVVLHPPVLKRLHTQRVGQMHPGPGFPEGVDRPIPAIGGLEHHLWILPGALDHPIQALDVVEDPDRLQHFPGPGRSDDHTAPPVQINTNELLPCVL